MLIFSVLNFHLREEKILRHQCYYRKLSLNSLIEVTWNQIKLLHCYDNTCSLMEKFCFFTRIFFDSIESVIKISSLMNEDKNQHFLSWMLLWRHFLSTWSSATVVVVVNIKSQSFSSTLCSKFFAMIFSSYSLALYFWHNTVRISAQKLLVKWWKLTTGVNVTNILSTAFHAKVLWAPRIRF